MLAKWYIIFLPNHHQELKGHPDIWHDIYGTSIDQRYLLISMDIYWYLLISINIYWYLLMGHPDIWHDIYGISIDQRWRRRVPSSLVSRWWAVCQRSQWVNPAPPTQALLCARTPFYSRLLVIAPNTTTTACLVHLPLKVSHSSMEWTKGNKSWIEQFSILFLLTLNCQSLPQVCTYVKVVQKDNSIKKSFFLIVTASFTIMQCLTVLSLLIGCCAFKSFKKWNRKRWGGYMCQVSITPAERWESKTAVKDKRWKELMEKNPGKCEEICATRLMLLLNTNWCHR